MAGDRAGAVARWHALAGFAAETRHALAGLLADAGLLLVQATPGSHVVGSWGALQERAVRLGKPGPLALVSGHLARAALDSIEPVSRFLAASRRKPRACSTSPFIIQRRRRVPLSAQRTSES